MDITRARDIDKSAESLSDGKGSEPSPSNDRIERLDDLTHLRVAEQRSAGQNQQIVREEVNADKAKKDASIQSSAHEQEQETERMLVLSNLFSEEENRQFKEYIDSLPQDEKESFLAKLDSQLKGAVEIAEKVSQVIKGDRSQYDDTMRLIAQLDPTEMDLLDRAFAAQNGVRLGEVLNAGYQAELQRQELQLRLEQESSGAALAFLLFNPNGSPKDLEQYIGNLASRFPSKTPGEIRVSVENQVVELREKLAGLNPTLRERLHDLTRSEAKRIFGDVKGLDEKHLEVYGHSLAKQISSNLSDSDLSKLEGILPNRKSCEELLRATVEFHSNQLDGQKADSIVSDFKDQKSFERFVETEIGKLEMLGDRSSQSKIAELREFVRAARELRKNIEANDTKNIDFGTTAAIVNRFRKYAKKSDPDSADAQVLKQMLRIDSALGLRRDITDAESSISYNTDVIEGAIVNEITLNEYKEQLLEFGVSPVELDDATRHFIFGRDRLLAAKQLEHIMAHPEKYGTHFYDRDSRTYKVCAAESFDSDRRRYCESDSDEIDEAIVRSLTALGLKGEELDQKVEALQKQLESGYQALLQPKLDILLQDANRLAETGIENAEITSDGRIVASSDPTVDHKLELSKLLDAANPEWRSKVPEDRRQDPNIDVMTALARELIPNKELDFNDPQMVKLINQSMTFGYLADHVRGVPYRDEVMGFLSGQMVPNTPAEFILLKAKMAHAISWGEAQHQEDLKRAEAHRYKQQGGDAVANLYSAYRIVSSPLRGISFGYWDRIPQAYWNGVGAETDQLHKHHVNREGVSGVLIHGTETVGEIAGAIAPIGWIGRGLGAVKLASNATKIGAIVNSGLSAGVYSAVYDAGGGFTDRLKRFGTGVAFGSIAHGSSSFLKGGFDKLFGTIGADKLIGANIFKNAVSEASGFVAAEGAMRGRDMTFENLTIALVAGAAFGGYRGMKESKSALTSKVGAKLERVHNLFENPLEIFAPKEAPTSRASTKPSQGAQTSSNNSTSQPGNSTNSTPQATTTVPGSTTNSGTGGTSQRAPNPGSSGTGTPSGSTPSSSTAPSGTTTPAGSTSSAQSTPSGSSPSKVVVDGKPVEQYLNERSAEQTRGEPIADYQPTGSRSVPRWLRPTSPIGRRVAGIIIAAGSFMPGARAIAEVVPAAQRAPEAPIVRVEKAPGKSIEQGLNEISTNGKRVQLERARESTNPHTKEQNVDRSKETLNEVQRSAESKQTSESASKTNSTENYLDTISSSTVFSTIDNLRMQEQMRLQQENLNLLREEQLKQEEKAKQDEQTRRRRRRHGDGGGNYTRRGEGPSEEDRGAPLPQAAAYLTPEQQAQAQMHMDRTRRFFTVRSHRLTDRTIRRNAINANSDGSEASHNEHAIDVEIEIKTDFKDSFGMD